MLKNSEMEGGKSTAQDAQETIESECTLASVCPTSVHVFTASTSVFVFARRRARARVI